MRDDDFLTVQEAADRYRVSRRTIERHIKAGRIPVTRIGRLIRIRRTDLDRAFSPDQPPRRRARPRGSKGRRNGRS